MFLKINQCFADFSPSQKKSKPDTDNQKCNRIVRDRPLREKVEQKFAKLVMKRLRGRKARSEALWQVATYFSFLFFFWFNSLLSKCVAFWVASVCDLVKWPQPHFFARVIFMFKKETGN